MNEERERRLKAEAEVAVLKAQIVQLEAKLEQYRCDESEPYIWARLTPVAIREIVEAINNERW